MIDILEVMMLNRFDLVVIKTVKNIKYLSGPSGRPAKPQGVWVIIHVFDDKTVFLGKDETVIRIPIDDIDRVARYDINTVIDKLKNTRRMDDLKGDSNDKSQAGQAGGEA